HSNAFFGGAAGIGNTSGNFNAFFGDGAGSDFYDPNVERTGSLNTFIGSLSGGGVTTGSSNTFLGSNTSGSSNIDHATAIGADSAVTTSDTIVLGKVAGTYSGVARPADTVRIPGDLNVSGSLSLNIVNASTQYNLGGNRLISTAGAGNLFVGFSAGQSNTPGIPNPSSGIQNTFVGSGSGAANTSAFNNAFFGFNAGLKNTASENSFFGALGGQANTTGDRNAFFGVYAGENNVSGCCNSFFGNKVG